MSLIFSSTLVHEEKRNTEGISHLHGEFVGIAGNLQFKGENTVITAIKIVFTVKYVQLLFECDDDGGKHLVCKIIYKRSIVKDGFRNSSSNIA